MGLWKERVVLYWLLDQCWGLGQRDEPMNLLQGGVKNKDWFRRELKNKKEREKLHQPMVTQFCKAMEGREDLKDRFDELCDRFCGRRDNVPSHDSADRNKLIGDLRAFLAGVCVDALEPDLVILDEFQRFKHLLSGDSDASELARRLFEYSDEATDVRTLLLSATPYKMYTLYEEASEDNHYEDFLHTLRFLSPEETDVGEFEVTLEEYRKEIFRLGNEQSENRLPELHGVVQEKLKNIMVRTERSRGATGIDDMVCEVHDENVTLKQKDIKGYIGIQKISNELGQGDLMEYWKSSPYLLNFMDDYKIKRAFEKEALGDSAGSLSKILSDSKGLLLPWETIESYKRVDPANAKLRRLLEQTVGQGAWRLLWIPPSLPHYRLGGEFAKVENKHITKQLVFSAWNVVPKVISTIVSYSAERKIMQSHELDPLNTKEKRKARGRLLNFNFTKERYTGLSILCLIYPSFSLAEIADPASYFKGRKLASLNSIAKAVISEIQDSLEVLAQYVDDEKDIDASWYWAAPILLDLMQDESACREWWGQQHLHSKWTGESDPDGDDKESRWSGHVDFARLVLDGKFTLGRFPRDLAQILAHVTLAGPGVVALRALSRVAGGRASFRQLSIRNEAAAVGWGFRSLFNSPEAIALLRGKRNRKKYWKRVLRYSFEGGLQSVLDEYVHVLHESLGVQNMDREKAIVQISEVLRTPLTLMTSSMDIDEIKLPEDGGLIDMQKRSMRGHFALRFGDQRSEDGKREAREDHVRMAFNSPFWPFVLATTSVGQEGLDFHPYCHSVVHWNLPSNPVDMEQREGRVHRYKGHAVRKNVAEKHGHELNEVNGHDHWQHLFDCAHQTDDGSQRGLSPYWIYPGTAKVERHVPALPLSKEQLKLEGLRRSLAVYRMVFGQPRQEDLLSYLSNILRPEQLNKNQKYLQIDLSPPPQDED